MEQRISQERFNGAEVLFLAEEGKESQELLFYEEDLITNPGMETAPERGKKLWQRVKNWYEQSAVELFAGDRFVRRLGYFRKIKVLMTRPIDTAVVKARLQQMLRDRSYHHLRWMAIDLLLLPLTFFTMFLPGPNVLFFYLVFRIYSHWMTYRSASKTVLENVEVEVSGKASEVNAILRKGSDMRSFLKEVRDRYRLRAFQEHHFVPLQTHFKEVWLKLKQHFA